MQQIRNGRDNLIGRNIRRLRIERDCGKWTLYAACSQMVLESAHQHI